MRRIYLILFGITIFSLLVIFSLYSFPETTSTTAGTATITYNILDWGASGSFTVQFGTTQNATTAKTTGYIKIKDNKENIIAELNPENIDKQINEMKKVAELQAELRKKMDPSIKVHKINVEEHIASLQKVKEILEDKDKFDKLIKDMEQLSTQTEGGFNWSKAFSTIRGAQINANGRITW